MAYGLVYHYFDSKEEILNELFLERWQIMLDAIAEIDRRQEVPARDKLYMVASFIIDSYRHEPDLMKVIIVEVTRAANSFGRLHLEKIREAYAGIAEIVEGGAPDGSVQVRHLLRVRGDVLLRGDRAAALRAGSSTCCPQTEEEFERAKGLVVEAICGGLETPAAGSPGRVWLNHAPMENDLVKRLVWSGLLAGVGALPRSWPTARHGHLDPGLRRGPARLLMEASQAEPAGRRAGATRRAVARRRPRGGGARRVRRAPRGLRGRRLRRRARPGRRAQVARPMTPPGRNGADKTLGEIVAEVSEKASLLVREEIELAKAEVTQQGQDARRGRRRGRRGRRVPGLRRRHVPARASPGSDQRPARHRRSSGSASRIVTLILHRARRDRRACSPRVAGSRAADAGPGDRGGQDHPRDARAPEHRARPARALHRTRPDEEATS